MAFTVTIKDVKTEQRDGPHGPYDVTDITYDYKGTEKTFLAFPGHYKKYPNLSSEIKSLKAGMTVGFETTKTDKGSDISKIITEGGPAPVMKSTASYKPKSTYTPNDNAIGAQVGNAITNAVSTLGQGATLAQIEQRVYDLILIGERTKRRLERGEHLNQASADNNTAASQENQQSAHSFDDTDISF